MMIFIIITYFTKIRKGTIVNFSNLALHNKHKSERILKFSHGSFRVALQNKK